MDVFFQWSFTLSPKLDCSGMISTHCNLLLSDTVFHHVGQDDLKLLISSDSTVSASQNAGITGTLMKLETIILSKPTQEHETKHCVYSLIKRWRADCHVHPTHSCGKISTGCNCPSSFVNGKAAHGVNDHTVAEDAETGEEENAAVQVEVEAEADELAHEIAKDPVLAVGIVVNQEGEAGQIQQICAGQVHHDDGAALPGSHFENVSGDRYCIPWKSHEEDNAVNNGEENKRVQFGNMNRMRSNSLIKEIRKH
ncbi:Zinc finger protein [Plecturocebus cupreus]